MTICIGVRIEETVLMGGIFLWQDKLVTVRSIKATILCQPQFPGSFPTSSCC